MNSANATDIAQVISAIAATAAAIFAAASAGVSRAAVERGNLAFVWPEFWVDEPDENYQLHRLRVRLHSDGPGIALDVRWSVFFHPEPGRKAMRREEESVAANATPAVRALRPGESSPTTALPADEFPMPPHLRDEPWVVVVRWSDSAGRRWEFNEWSAGRELAPKPKKLRRARW